MDDDLESEDIKREEIDIDYRRKSEELREPEDRARIQKIIIDNDDDDLGFYAVHPNTDTHSLSQNEEPNDSHHNGRRHINTTPETETISYPKESGFELTAFSDADHAGCLDMRKITSGGIQFLDDNCAKVIWMRTQLKDDGFNYNKIPMYCNSQSAIAISCNPVQHSRTKHIHTPYHFIKEQVENGKIEMYFVRTEYQLAYMFTKALPEDRFQYLVRRIGMRCSTPTDLEALANESA
ncbi:hypothetical protein Tco_1343157 [Tanacetum coccineum]